MSRSSCISEPENEPLILVKQWMVDISTDEKGKANHCAATLIGFFKYFHEVKIEISAKNRIANDVAEKHGEKRVHDESLYQFHTIEDLGERMLGFFSKNTIRSAISLLVHKGIIKTFANPNPRYKFDKTTFFLFSPKNCKELLKNRRKSKPETIESQNWNIDGSELTDRYSKNDPTSSKSDPVIPKTTSKTTEEEAKQKIYQEDIAHGQHKPIESAANFLVSENEIANGSIHCQAQSPIAGQATDTEKQSENNGKGISYIEPTTQKINAGDAAADENGFAEKPVDHVSVVGGDQDRYGEMPQATEPQPSAKPTTRTSHGRPVKPMVKNTKPYRSNGVAEPVIGDALTENQRSYVAKMVETFASRNTGLTVANLEAEVLNLNAFPRCGKDFLHKVNSICIQLRKGTWTPRKAQKPSASRNQWSPDSAAVSDSTNPAVMAMRNRESVDGRVSAIRRSIASIKATFTDCMARFRDEFFFAGQREKIAKLEEELRQLGAGTPDVTEFPVSNGFNPDQRHAVGGAK